MAKMYGGQSRYLVENYKLDNFAIFAVLFFASGFFWILLNKGILFNISGWILTFVFGSPLLIYLFIELIIYKNSARNFLNGSKGEGAIWYELRNLPDEYHVFQDIKNPNKSNTDFVVVGPTGVFTVEVKNRSGIFTLENGVLFRYKKPLEKDPLKQAKSQAGEIHTYLKDFMSEDIFIKPVLVFSSYRVKVNFGMKPVEDVFVIKKPWLNKLITEESNNPISKSTIDSIVEKLNLKLNAKDY